MIKTNNLQTSQIILEIIFSNSIRLNKISSAELDSIIKLASSNLVLPLLLSKIKSKGLQYLFNTNFIEYLEFIYKENLKRNKHLIKEVRFLSKILQKNNIRHVFIKGSAHVSSKIYDDFGERMVGDIDILIEKNQIGNTINLMNKHKYFFKDSQSFLVSRHLNRLINFNKIFAVELHTKVVENDKDLLSNELIIKDRKINNDGIYTPSFNHQKLINIYNSEINDLEYYSAKINFRTLYDHISLSSTYENITEFGNYNKYTQNFFWKLGKLKIDNKNKSKLNLKVMHKLRLNFSKRIPKLGILFFKIAFLYVKIKQIPTQIFNLFYNKKYRKYLFKRILKN